MATTSALDDLTSRWVHEEECKLTRPVGGFGRVVVPYPRGVRTGGPEALHQLVDSLRRQGVEAWLWPTPATRSAERVSDYAHYDAPEALEMGDFSDTAVVFPETDLDSARFWFHARPFMWWLSVDNSPYFRGRRVWERRWDEGSPSAQLLRQVGGSSFQVLFRHRARLRAMTHLTSPTSPMPTCGAQRYCGQRCWATTFT